ncbi:MAG: basic amino acid ABC transporter substrate-binding protein [Pseudomonadota bacterium]
MLRKVLLTCAAVLMTANVAMAEEKTIVFAHDATWPPMEFVDINKNVVGLAVDYTDAIAKEAGFTVVHRNVAWDGIFAGLAAGKYDAIASSVTITEERRKAMDFTEPYFEVKQAVVVPKDCDATSLEDLKGKTLGAQIGTTGLFAIKAVDGVNPKPYDEIGLAMEDLYNGRIDGAVCDDPVAANYALQQEQYAEKLKIAFIVASPTPEYYGIAVKKGNQELLDLLNKGIADVKAKGIDKEIHAKWVGGSK